MSDQDYIKQRANNRAGRGIGCLWGHRRGSE